MNKGEIVKKIKLFPVYVRSKYIFQWYLSHSHNVVIEFKFVKYKVVHVFKYLEEECKA